MRKRDKKKAVIYSVIFVVVNILAIVFVGKREATVIDNNLQTYADETKEQFDKIMEEYKHSFRLFTEILARELYNNPEPDDMWNYLKDLDKSLLEIEGNTFDGVYMYYQGRYLYSWNTPYAQYEETGYDATERPWYKDAVEGKGAIVFTPPYKSYANNYVLTTISQLQPDGETVFAYDIKMTDIQTLVTKQDFYDNEKVLIYEEDGTIIGCTYDAYLGKSLEQFKEAAGLEGIGSSLDEGHALPVRLGGSKYYSCNLRGDGFNFLVLVPQVSILKETMAAWLIPILAVELLLIYILATFSRGQRNRELRQAYVELGQTQRRLEIALSMAQEAAAIDDLTGMMNAKSFRKEMSFVLGDMAEETSGILLMIDGDHFKRVNDNYGHNTGDEVIKLTAQMIIGRIRTVDLASRLHGDEFAIFIADISDFTVAKKIMEDINLSLEKESRKRGLPAITLSAGAVAAKRGDSYTALSKAADAALYQAKETHNGGFACNTDV